MINIRTMSENEDKYTKRLQELVQDTTMPGNDRRVAILMESVKPQLAGNEILLAFQNPTVNSSMIKTLIKYDAQVNYESLIFVLLHF